MVDNVNFLSDKQKAMIVDIIKEASKQHHGTMLVFNKEAEVEATRLGKSGRALELEPITYKAKSRTLCSWHLLMEH